MKHIFKIALTIVSSLLCVCSFSFASASTKYELTIYNTTLMPLSPPIVYTIEGSNSAAPVGTQATASFVQLCQSGDNAARFEELNSNSAVKFTAKANGPILPGQSQTFEVIVKTPHQQSIHFETMYGKTKDVCGVGSVNSHSLVALKQHATTEVIQKDSALITGAFLAPVLPVDGSYTEGDFCTEAMNAVSCLRELSLPASDNKQIKFFSGYLPSLINSLEAKYGVADLQTLLFLPSGAIQYKLKLKH